MRTHDLHPNPPPLLLPFAAEYTRRWEGAEQACCALCAPKPGAPGLYVSNTPAQRKKLLAHFRWGFKRTAG